MSEKNGDKHVFSYMDGIPVKISEKYKPPRKIILPVGFQNRLLQPPVTADYDFQFEKDVLENLQQWRSSRSKEKERRKQHLAEQKAERQKAQEAMQELEETMHELSTEEKCSMKKPGSFSPPPVLTTPSQQPSKVLHTLPSQSSVCTSVINEVNPILRPIPIKHQVVSTQINNNKPISAFNLSDFEADTSSPFDNMELKTINDLEELAQVLQPSTVTQATGFYQNTISSVEHFGNMHHAMSSNQGSCVEQSFNPSKSDNVLNDCKSGVNYQPHVNGYSSNFEYHTMQNYHPQSVIPHLNPHNQGAAYSFAEREQISQPSELSFGYVLQNTPPQFQNYFSSSVWPSVGPYGPTSHDSSAFGNVLVASVPTPKVPPFTLPSSSSLDEEEKVQEGGQEPSISSQAQQLSNLMKSRSSRCPSKPSELTTVSIRPSACTPSTPTEQDPFQSLNSESQSLVQKIAEMGFPRVRVARACKNLGANDKKIVEFLLSLQSLLDAGYQEGCAERALCLHNQDVNASTKFLQAELQLLDLGFPRDRVSEALLKFNCDRDQALDFLIS